MSSDLSEPLSLSAASFLSSEASEVSGSPSAVSSVVVSGSFTTVGAATDATVKSRSVIVGVTPSDKLAPEILIVSPISRPSKSKMISSGILFAGQLNCTVLLLTLRTPPLFNPGESSSLINRVGISRVILESSASLKKSICIGWSDRGSN